MTRKYVKGGKRNKNRQRICAHNRMHGVCLACNPLGHASHLISQARKRSRDTKRKVSITPRFVAKLYALGCPVCNLNYAQYETPQSSRASPTSPSLDRNDSTKGYTKANTWVMCHRCNTRKNNSTVEDTMNQLAFLLIAQKYQRTLTTAQWFKKRNEALTNLRKLRDKL